MNIPLKTALLVDGRGAWRVGARVGLSPSVISRIVNGHRAASVLEKKLLAAELGYSVPELFPQRKA